MNKNACRYAIVQFMPYPETGEFANVGVIVAVPQQNQFGFQLETAKCGRLTRFFQHLDRRVYLAAVKALEEELQYLVNEVADGQLTAQRAFDLMVRPLEAILRFSKERVKMTPKPKTVTSELFERFVMHDFAQKKNYEKELQSRVGHLVRGLNLRQQFKKTEVGTTLYSINMPLVQQTDDDQLRVIQPLHFDRADPEKIIDHGNLWAGKLGTLKDLGKLPEDILIPVEHPLMNQKDLEQAWLMTRKKLANFGDLTDASNEKEIEKFAKG